MTSICMKKSCVFGCGGFLVVFAGIMLGTWPIMFNAVLKKKLTLAPDSMIYDMWVETPIPLYLDLFLFNMTNADKFAKNHKVKPEFVQLGPYSFSEIDYKTNVSFNTNDTVTFRQKKVWIFDKNRSNGSLDDLITNINVMTATIAYAVRNRHYLIRKAVNFFLEEKGEQLIVTKTASELLFCGYDDPMIDLIRDLNVTAVDIPYDKFGYFYPRNESITYDGIFNMYTGKDKLAKVGMMHSWNYWTKTPYYKDTCGMVNGTLGTLWPPIKDARTVSMFVTDTCSSITLVRDGSFEKFGINGYKFIGDAHLLDNGTKYPDMECFQVGDKVPSGVRNVSACKFGAPAFVSYPHFYLADPIYRENIKGMEPNKSEHELYLVLEPNSGIPMEVRAQLQINIMIQEYSGISAFDNMPQLFIPTLLFRQSASLTKELADQAKMVVLIPRIGNYTFIGFACIGILLLFIGVVLTLQKGWKGKQEPLLAVDT